MRTLRTLRKSSPLSLLRSCWSLQVLLQWSLFFVIVFGLWMISWAELSPTQMKTVRNGMFLYLFLLKMFALFLSVDLHKPAEWVRWWWIQQLTREHQLAVECLTILRLSPSPSPSSSRTIPLLRSKCKFRWWQCGCWRGVWRGGGGVVDTPRLSSKNFARTRCIKSTLHERTSRQHFRNHH